MRVNIGYGCDLEDVLEEASSFLERVSSKLSDVAVSAGASATAVGGENYNPQEVLLDIHKMRVSLNKVDLRLEDVGVIIVGLENAKIKAAEEAAAAELAAQEEEPLAPVQLAEVPVEEPVEEPQEVSSRVRGPTEGKKKRRKKKGKS